MPPYVYKSEKTHLIKALKQSLSEKKKACWSRETSPGFICEDLVSVTLDGTNIRIRTESYGMSCPTRDFNLRETEELIKFLERD